MDFTFVTDQNIRAVLNDYYNQATVSAKDGLHLTAIVSAGAVAEGLLTWALSAREQKAPIAKHAGKNNKASLPPTRMEPDQPHRGQQ